MSKEINKDDIQNFSKCFEDKAQNDSLMKVIMNTGIEKASVNREVAHKADHLFNHKIDDWEVMDQKQSGRCWVFAGMNLYKPGLCKKYNLEDIKLSANFIQFWDFLEKSNLFLNDVESTADRSMDDELVRGLFSANLEGGWWDMFINVVNKHGIVPDTIMPGTHDSDKTAFLCRVLRTYLRRQGRDIRLAMTEGKGQDEITKIRKNAMSKVYEVLCIHLGKPPETFDWTYQDKDKNVKSERGITPLEFSKVLEPQESITLINDPREERPLNKHYSCKYIGNVIDGNLLDFLNVDIDTMKQMVKKMIDAGRLVWMSCDVSKFANHDAGVFSSECFHYDSILGLGDDFTKAERLRYQDSGGNHAMLFTGYHEVEGKIVKWRIENSWGEKKGKKGYYEMSDEWFSEYVYTALVSKEYLTDEMKEICKEDPVMLEPWEFPY